MSYILEALKKAQAERQLGALPTIHAPAMQGGHDAGAGTTLKKPLWLALMAMALVIIALLALVWRQGTQATVPAPAGAPAAGVSGSGATPVAVVLPTVQEPPPAKVAAEPKAPAGFTAPPSRPEMVTPAAPRARPVATPVPAESAQSGGERAVAPVTRAVVASAPPPAASDETLQTVRDLPEPIQRAIPVIAVGGYMYSKNPADRLVLIDKVLRHEGEEVAPGLVLEKLLPKAAVFSFKGYRYRVPY